MRKSIVAGLALVAALAVAGQVRAEDGGKSTAEDAGKNTTEKVQKVHKTTTHRRHHEAVNRADVAPPANTQFRIPAQPVVRDCVHVMFPQCARGFDGLNDGVFPLRQ